MVAALRSFLVATALLAVFATAASAQDPSCDQTWNGTTGNWGDASRWSGGAVPNGNERACLPNGGYTVTWTGSTTPRGVTVGSGVILLVKEFQGLDARSSSFINHGTVRLEQNATLFGPLVNDGTVEDTGTIPAGNNRPNLNGSIVNSGTIRANQGLNFNRQDGTVQSTGKLETASADALINGTGYADGTWTISGTVANPGTMQFQAGTMRVRAMTAQSGNPFRTYQSKLDLTGATGRVETIQTVDLVTDIPAAATVRVTGRNDDANLRLDADHTNNGTLVFDSADQNRSTSLSNINTAARLTNTGTLRVTGTTGADRNVRIPITNTATGTMTVDAGNRMVFQNDAGETITAGTLTVNGNVWVQGGGSTNPSRITQTGGAITVASGVSLFFTGGRYTHQGGTTSGEIQFQNNSTIDASGPGAATYHVVGYATLAGNVNAAGTINLEASGGQPANLTLAAPSTMAGRMTFTTGGANAQDTEINGGQRLTVTGRVDVLRGQGGTRHFKVPLTIAAGGQFNVEALSTALLDGVDTLAHEIAGTLTVAGGGYFGVRSGTQTVTQTGGTINGAGAFSIENLNAFVHQGGTIPGELQLQNGSLLDPSGPGAATYHVVGVTKLTGDVNAAATINADANWSGSGTAQLTLTAPRTVAGRINFTSSGPAAVDTEVNGGQRLTVTGRIDVQKGVGGTRHFKVPLTIAAGGQSNVEASTTALLDGVDTLAHEIAGTLTVAGGGYFGVRSGTQTVTQTGGTINGAGAFSIENLNAFVHQGGTIPGELQLQNGSSLDPSGPGAASYRVLGSITLAGDVNAAATVNGEANGITSYPVIALNSDRTVAGTLNLYSVTSAQDTRISSPNGSRLTISGTLNARRGVGGIRNFEVPITVTSTGTFALDALSTVYVTGSNTPMESRISGTVTVPSDATLLWRVSGQTVRQLAGTINASGRFVVEGNVFKHEGGTIVGAVTVSSSGLVGQLDPSGPGTASYLIVNSVTLIADVNVDADIQVGQGNDGGVLYVRDHDVTNRGTIEVGVAGIETGATLGDYGQPNTLTNAGTLTFAKGGGRTLNLRIVNTGTLNVNDATGGISAIEDKPLITNSGGTVTVNKAGFTTWRGYTQTSGLTDIIDGSIGSPRNPADILIQGGRMRGTGVLFGPVTNSATLEVGRVGTPYGKLEIRDVVDQIVRVGAAYTQTATGRLAIDVGGTTAGTSFDQLGVEGPATLGGALDLTTAAGYTPNPATPDKYRVVASETVTGAFADLSGALNYTAANVNGAPDGLNGLFLTARTPPPPASVISVADASVVEGAGPLTFTATLSKAASSAVTVDWATEDDTAVAGADYTTSSGTLTFPAGSLTQTFTVPVIDDTVVEPAKELLVRLRHPGNALLGVATAIGRIDPDDVGITSTAPTRVGDAGPATITITGGGFAPGSTVKLSRAGEFDRNGVIVSGPDKQSKLGARFDMRNAAQGAWTLTVRTPSGVTATAPITVQNGPPALYAVLTTPSSLRFGWVARATLSLRNTGTNDVGIDVVRFVGSSMELRSPGSTDFAGSVSVSGDELGDAAVIPALSTRTVSVELRSTTTVGHAYMGLDAEVYPTGYLSQTIKGSDPDPGTGSIKGHVTNATGQPVRGLTVTAFDGTNSASAKTDGAGAYSLNPLKPGTYRVEAGLARGSAVVNENARTVDLVTGVTDLAGTVGKGDATLTLLQGGRALTTTTADATGGFRFRVAKAGAYTIVADSPSSGRASRAVTVVAGVDQPGLKLTLGTRTLKVHTSGGATVRVWPAGEEAAPTVRVADAGGLATFPGLGAGALTVEARAAGMVSKQVVATTDDVSVTPVDGAAVSGLVTDAGVAVPGAVVIAVAADSAPTHPEQHFAVSGADGRYSVTGLAAGAYDVWVLGPGYPSLVKRGVAAGTTSADAALVRTGAALDVVVGDKRLGKVVRAIDPATGVVVSVAATGTAAGIAPLGPLPAGTYRVEGDGVVAKTVTIAGAGSGSAKAARAAAAQENVILDEDGYPVVEDPEVLPNEKEYVSPYSQLRRPQLNEKDRLMWDRFQQDYATPCPTAARIYDQLLMLKKRKLVSFQRWVDAFDAIEELNSAEVALYMTKAGLFLANTTATAVMMGKTPADISGTLAGVIQNGANYLGALSTLVQGGDPPGNADVAGGLNDLINTVGSAMSEASGKPSALSYLTSVLGALKSAKELFDDTRAFSNDVKARGDNYLQAQSAYEKTILDINDMLKAYAEAKLHCPDPTDKGPKAPVNSGGRIENITSNDPNEILGPAGFGASKWIPRSQALGYMIRFENLGPGSVIPPGQQPASAPATIVKVVTTLSPSVDADAVTLGNVGWGAVELSVPSGLTTFHKDVPQADGDIVRVDGAINVAARTITWTIKTIDPATGEVDGSPTAGFLPPEDGTRRGQGHVDYNAGTAGTVSDGTTIAAKATITFDVNTPIETNTHSNAVDATPPTSTVQPGDPSCDGKIPVQWSGADGGSGVATYDVEVSGDGAKTFKPWLTGVAATSGTYAGVPGQAYAFRVMARDAVGNAQAAAVPPYATKAVGPCDLEAPRTIATAPGGAKDGWYDGPVEVALDAVDAPGGSGVASIKWAANGPASTIPGAAATARVTGEGANDLVFAATDVRGNVEADAHLPVRIDTTPPTITALDGAEYTVGQAVAPNVTCADAGVGVATCVFPAALDTTVLGEHTFTVNAADKLGHTSAVTRRYTVVPSTNAGPPGGGGNGRDGDGGGGGTGGDGGGVKPPPPAVTFGKAPVKVKLGKVSKTAVALTLTSAERFAFTGKATLVTSGKKPKAQSKAGSFSLAAGNNGKLTLKLNAAGKKALKGGRRVKLVLRLELKSGVAKKTVDVKVTLRAR